uniref:Collagen alpha-1(I) chain-like n=1 Tax=Echinococcus granulosus TaxID=6210 RepID=A0A068WS77_ECHGR|nr:hypothetical protein EgrG_001121800 [Echinococcus granulosus]
MSYEHHFFIDLLMANPLPKQSDKADTSENSCQDKDQQAASPRRGDCISGPSTGQPESPPQKEECPLCPGTGQPEAEEHAPAPSANQPKLCPQNVEECPPAPSAGQPGFRPQNVRGRVLAPRAGQPRFYLQNEYFRHSSTGQVGNDPHSEEYLRRTSTGQLENRPRAEEYPHRPSTGQLGTGPRTEGNLRGSTPGQIGDGSSTVCSRRSSTGQPGNSLHADEHPLCPSTGQLGNGLRIGQFIPRPSTSQLRNRLPMGQFIPHSGTDQPRVNPQAVGGFFRSHSVGQPRNFRIRGGYFPGPIPGQVGLRSRLASVGVPSYPGRGNRLYNLGTGGQGLLGARAGLQGVASRTEYFPYQNAGQEGGSPRRDQSFPCPGAGVQRGIPEIVGGFHYPRAGHQGGSLGRGENLPGLNQSQVEGGLKGGTPGLPGNQLHDSGIGPGWSYPH